MLALLAFLSIVQDAPSHATQPTPAQITTSDLTTTKTELAQTRAELERTNFEILRRDQQGWWTTIVALLGGSGGAIALAKGYAAWRLQVQATTHRNEIERLNTEAQIKAMESKSSLEAQLALAKAAAEAKKGDAASQLQSLNEKLDELKAERAEDAKCYDAEKRELRDHISKAEARIDELRQRIDDQQKQIVHLQTAARDFAFASWGVGRDGKIMQISGNADRNILAPMGRDRHQMELLHEDEAWPKEAVPILKFLREKAMDLPGHAACVIGAKIHPKIQPLILAKIMGQHPNGDTWGHQTVAIPMTSVVEVPPELLDLAAADDRSGKPISPAA